MVLYLSYKNIVNSIQYSQMCRVIQLLKSVWQNTITGNTILLLLTSPFYLCVCVFLENDETGVMDSLLEALQSGAAFRDRRKRAPRPRGESLNPHLYIHWHTDKAQHWYRLAMKCLTIIINSHPKLFVRFGSKHSYSCHLHEKIHSFVVCTHACFQRNARESLFWQPYYNCLMFGWCLVSFLAVLKPNSGTDNLKEHMLWRGALF